MATGTATPAHRPSRRRGRARARGGAARPATPDGFHQDADLTRRWRGAYLRLLTPARAWLLPEPPGGADPTLVGQAPAGSTVEAVAAYRAGPLTAELRCSPDRNKHPKPCSWLIGTASPIPTTPRAGRRLPAMSEYAEPSAARYERDIGELHGAVRNLQQSLDGHIRHTAETFGELRSEQRRQANMLDERGRQLDQHGEQLTAIQGTLTEMQSMLDHITRRLDGQ
jgi:hypothetical protein